MTALSSKTENPWTTAALANDYHLGDRREARLIAAENGNDPAEKCGKCGEMSVHYRQTVGASQCVRCHAIRVPPKEMNPDGSWPRDPAGGWLWNWL